MRSLSVPLILVAVLASGCDYLEPDKLSSGEKGLLSYGSLVLSTPPANTILFGPCSDEFGMPDARRGACDVYYAIRFKKSPWRENADAVRASSYQPSNLYCMRTLGGVPECSVVSGPVNPPSLMAPNMGSN